MTDEEIADREELKQQWKDKYGINVNPPSHDTASPFNKEQLEEAYQSLKKLKIPTTENRLSNKDLQEAINDTRHMLLRVPTEMDNWEQVEWEHYETLLEEQLKRATDG